MVELIALILIIAVFVLVITPEVVEKIKEGRLAKARHETVIIGSAIMDFHKDLGIWPFYGEYHSFEPLPPRIYLLISEKGESGFSIRKDAGYWMGVKVFEERNIDTIENQLMRNRPGGQSVYVYPTSGDYRWKGPYLSERAGPDPWGNHYSVNIAFITTPDIIGFGKNLACWVLSAGPNGIWETSFAQSNEIARGFPYPPRLNNLSLSRYGDDIGFKLK